MKPVTEYKFQKGDRVRLTDEYKERTRITPGSRLLSHINEIFVVSSRWHNVYTNNYLIDDEQEHAEGCCYHYLMEEGSIEPATETEMKLPKLKLGAKLRLFGVDYQVCDTLRAFAVELRPVKYRENKCSRVCATCECKVIKNRMQSTVPLGDKSCVLSFGSLALLNEFVDNVQLKPVEYTATGSTKVEGSHKRVIMDLSRLNFRTKETTLPHPFCAYCGGTGIAYKCYPLLRIRGWNDKECFCVVHSKEVLCKELPEHTGLHLVFPKVDDNLLLALNDGKDETLAEYKFASWDQLVDFVKTTDLRCSRNK